MRDLSAFGVSNVDMQRKIDTGYFSVVSAESPIAELPLVLSRSLELSRDYLTSHCKQTIVRRRVLISSSAVYDVLYIFWTSVAVVFLCL